jgi:hypothetical protein
VDFKRLIVITEKMTASLEKTKAAMMVDQEEMKASGRVSTIQEKMKTQMKGHKGSLDMKDGGSI